MDQYVDSRQKEILWDLLANPADNGSSYIQSLELLVQDNPQSGLLQVLLARAGDKKQLSKATVYFNPRTLHKVVNHPQELAVVNDASIIHSIEGIYTTTQNFFNTGTATAKSIDADAFDNNGYDAPAKQESIVAEEPQSDPAQFDDANAFDNNGYNSPEQQEVIVADEPVSEPLQIIEEQEEEPTQVVEQPEVTEEVAFAPVDNYEQPETDNAAKTQDANEEEAVEEITEAPVIGSEYHHTYHAFENSEPENIEQPVTETPVENAYQYNEPEATTQQPLVEKPALVAEQQPVQQTPPPIPQYEGPRFNSRFPKPGAQNTPEPEQTRQDIEDDVYDEIVGIEDIGFKAALNEVATAPVEARFSEPHIDSSPEEEEASEVLFHQPQPVVEPLRAEHKHIQEQEERLIMDSAIGADFLSFDKKLDELCGVNNTAPFVQEAAPVENLFPVATQPTAQLAEPAGQQVSRYDDDKMPYTFMWWLNKTRKEHAETFQPYTNGEAPSANTKPNGGEAARPAKRGSGNELQQQYYENIFSLTSISGVQRGAEAAPVAFDPGKKEDVIIERFIHTEPQIKPLSADKLDNENKAKRSSEDQNDFVTETLARIYCDQMLYHKAIATYKKLILKFPEKKLYFVVQIEQLEKKTN